MYTYYCNVRIKKSNNNKTSPTSNLKLLWLSHQKYSEDTLSMAVFKLIIYGEFYLKQFKRTLLQRQSPPPEGP